jgi:hypothetical protein
MPIFKGSFIMQYEVLGVYLIDFKENIGGEI